MLAAMYAREGADNNDGQLGLTQQSVSFTENIHSLKRHVQVPTLLILVLILFFFGTSNMSRADFLYHRCTKVMTV